MSKLVLPAKPLFFYRSVAFFALLLLLSNTPKASGEPVTHGVAAGLVKVTQVPGIDDNTNATASLALSINNLVVSSWNRGDYNLHVGVGLEASSDVERGILMTSVAENGRNNFGTNAYPVSSFATSGGGYRIVSYVSTAASGGSASEYNVNLSGAWFPYSHFLGGFACNSTNANGGVNDLFTGAPGLVLGTHLKALASGQFQVDLRPFGADSRSSGILLVNHAKDENNFALSQPRTDGTWNVFIRDCSQPTSNYEQDPVAFVYIPKTNTALISGRFLGNGTIAMFSGTTVPFNVSVLGTGRWGLEIPGHSPATGVLVVSAEGGSTLNYNNVVSYQPNAAGTGWEIQSRNTPNYALEALGTEPVASFVFIPAPTPGISVTPTNGLVTTAGGGSASFNVVLHSRPTADVTVNLSSSDPSKGTPMGSLMRFTSSTWNVPQTVRVSAASNAVPGLYRILLSPTASSDPQYQGLIGDSVEVQCVAARAEAPLPSDGYAQTGLRTGLNLLLSSNSPSPLTVTFYGRQAPLPPPGPDFTIAVLPDTQNYTAERGGGKKEMFISQIEWIITNRVTRNIVYVTQLGDIVNDGDIYLNLPNLTQWQNATNAMYRQENPVRTMLQYGIPYGVAVGNHEMEPISTPSGTTLFYNQYFGVQHFAGRPYYGGHYGTNNNNHFDLFSASGLDFIVLYFEYYDGGDPAALGWASQVLKTNANRRAIAVTHNMGNAQTPVTHSAQGAAIFKALRTNANFFLMLGGHVSGEGSRQDTFNGNIVRTFVQDYQSRVNGGNGLMRLLEFSPSNNVVVAQTYSPWTGQYETDDDSEFFFEYNLQPPGSPSPLTPFTSLGTNFGATAGSSLHCPWPGLQTNRNYEWYVTVTDATGLSAISPTWRFTTASSNSAPNTVNLSITIAGDSPTNLVLAATDVNLDPLTFELPTLPTAGLLRDFDSSRGTVCYVPARGLRGFDRFTFRVNDGAATSRVASMNLRIGAPPDDDNNGLPDAWETAYGVTDADADPDGDGASNQDEYYANTNPTNRTSALQILSSSMLTNGNLRLTWSAVGGTRYRVEYSNGDANGSVEAPFNEITRDLASEMDTNAVGEPSVGSFVDDLSRTGPATNGSRYYRVRVAR